MQGVGEVAPSLLLTDSRPALSPQTLMRPLSCSGRQAALGAKDDPGLEGDLAPLAPRRPVRGEPLPPLATSGVLAPSLFASLMAGSVTPDALSISSPRDRFRGNISVLVANTYQGTIITSARGNR